VAISSSFITESPFHPDAANPLSSCSRRISAREVGAVTFDEIKATTTSYAFRMKMPPAFSRIGPAVRRIMIVYMENKGRTKFCSRKICEGKWDQDNRTLH